MTIYGKSESVVEALLRCALVAKIGSDLGETITTRRAARHAVTYARLLAGQSGSTARLPLADPGEPEPGMPALEDLLTVAYPFAPSLDRDALDPERLPRTLL